MGKKFLLLTLSIAMLLTSIIGLTSCNINFDISETTIKDFTNYTSVGAGSVNNDASTMACSEDAIATSDSENYAKLVGVTKNGGIEEISFVRTTKKGAKEIEQTYYLERFRKSGNFFFVAFGKELPNYEQSHNSRDWSYYVIDLSSGKVYPLDEQIGYDNGLSTCLIYNDNQLVYVFNELTKNNEPTGVKTLKRIYVKDNKLVFEKIFSNKELTDIQPLAIDRYNNIIFKDFNINSKNEIVKHENIQLHKSINDIIYSDNLSKKVDSTGKLVQNTDNIEFINNKLDSLLSIAKIGKNEYFLEGTVTGGYGTDADVLKYNCNKLIKANWTDDTNFTLSEITLPENTEITNHASTNNRVYLKTTTDIMYLDLETDKVEIFNSDYVYNKLYLGNDDLIYFKGLDNKLNNVIGTINDKGEIDVEITSNIKDIFEIMPIN